MLPKLLGAAAAVLLVGCGRATVATVGTTPTSTAIAADAESLMARPLKLPAVQPGATCPVSTVVSVSPGVANPRGRGPFYLGGPMPKGAFAWNKTVYAVTGSAVPGPVLFRGGRIDGVGRLQFSGQPAAPSDKATHLTSDGGVSDDFYDHVLQGAGGGALYVYPSTRGCYAIQVDASTYEDVIVVSAS
jgi:hypothetical protein